MGNGLPKAPSERLPRLVVRSFSLPCLESEVAYGKMRAMVESAKIVRVARCHFPNPRRSVRAGSHHDIIMIDGYARTISSKSNGRPAAFAMKGINVYSRAPIWLVIQST
jgi:hypothetical protein